MQDAFEPLQPDGLASSANASRSSRRRPNATPSKSRSYLLSLGNVLVPVLQPGLRHRHRLDLLDHHLGVPDPRQRGTRSPAARSTRSASAPRSVSVLPSMPLYLIQAMIASISLVVMLGGLYADAGVVRRRRRTAGLPALR